MELRNVSGDTIEIPALGLVVPNGDTFEATGDEAKSLLASDNFERADKPAAKKPTDAASSADNKE